jgi:hypothetical protein
MLRRLCLLYIATPFMAVLFAALARGFRNLAGSSRSLILL